MSKDLLFAVGVGVFAITVCATLLYGYLTFNRIYEDAVGEERATRELADGLRRTETVLTNVDRVS